MTSHTKKLYCLKTQKEYFKTLGRRSISYIIKNLKNMKFHDKVNYIRHHYIEYDGNKEFFFDNRRRPNKNRIELDELIIGVIKGTREVSELKAFNKRIKAWRKEQKSNQQKIGFNL